MLLFHLACSQHACPLATDVLQAVGGLELAAMTGACLQAEKLDVPVVVDGFISGAHACFDDGKGSVFLCVCVLLVEQLAIIVD